MSLYIVTHAHEYGVDAHLVSSDEEPTEKQIVRELDINFEPSKSETLEITRLSDEEYRSPRRLRRLDGDDEEFEELCSHA